MLYVSCPTLHLVDESSPNNDLSNSWGPGSTPNWPQNAQAGINNGATHLLGMNEPDLDSQSNITPSAAATIWKTNMEPFFGKAKLVSPAITNGGAPMGVEWMKEFMGNCTGCHIDAVAMHWYDSATVCLPPLFLPSSVTHADLTEHRVL